MCLNSPHSDPRRKLQKKLHIDFFLGVDTGIVWNENKISQCLDKSRFKNTYTLIPIHLIAAKKQNTELVVICQQGSRAVTVMNPLLDLWHTMGLFLFLKHIWSTTMFSWKESTNRFSQVRKKPFPNSVHLHQSAKMKNALPELAPLMKNTPKSNNHKKIIQNSLKRWHFFNPNRHQDDNKLSCHQLEWIGCVIPATKTYTCSLFPHHSRSNKR